MTVTLPSIINQSIADGSAIVTSKAAASAINQSVTATSALVIARSLESPIDLEIV
jgi:hypothetical protein